MRILFIAPYVPSRIRVRPFQLIKELAKRHKIHVIALGESDKSQMEGVDEIMSVIEDICVVPHSRIRGCAQALLSLAHTAPISAAYCWSSAMSKQVDWGLAGEKFDLIHVEHLRAAHFAPRQSHIPMVFDAVDCLTGLFSQMARSKKNPAVRAVMKLEAGKLRRYEPKILGRFDRVVITSDSERDALLALDPRLNVNTVPNGVDTGYFRPAGLPKTPRRLIFSGKMSYSPNAQAAKWFAENAFPAIRSQWPDAEFVIAGSSPPASIKALEQVPGITVTGYLDDLRPQLESAAAAVVPMQTAVGIQNKALEAMAMGLAVVASSLATRAIGASTPGIIEASTAESVIDAVNRLFADSEAAELMGRDARAAVEEHFSWQAAAAELERIYDEVLPGRHA